MLEISHPHIQNRTNMKSFCFGQTFAKLNVSSHMQFGYFHYPPKQLVDYRVIVVYIEWNHTAHKLCWGFQTL